MRSMIFKPIRTTWYPWQAAATKNRLLNQEVMLDSVQFLAFAARVANALASSGRKPDEEEKAFIRDTGQVLIEHLLRWGSDSAISSMRQATGAKPEDVTNGSSKLFFTDKPLWMITMYAELAGIIQSGVSKDVIWGRPKQKVLV